MTIRKGDLVRQGDRIARVETEPWKYCGVDVVLIEGRRRPVAVHTLHVVRRQPAAAPPEPRPPRPAGEAS